CADGAEAGGTLRVGVGPSGGRIAVRLSLAGGGGAAAAAADREVDLELARRLGGELQMDRDGATIALATAP
ncbi:MAG TPA: hypothetical protein VI078_02860, partial [bacterium]